ncbi:hypothetical protein llg_00410 [Luteolibacter sp. LG18]|nr:hypothetical protein llg_00410 [Luteolibacter sp. LG18]
MKRTDGQMDFKDRFRTGGSEQVAKERGSWAKGIVARLRFPGALLRLKAQLPFLIRTIFQWSPGRTWSVPK